MFLISFWELNYGNNRFFTRKSEESISLVESVDIPARVDRVSHYGCRKSEKGGNEKDFFKNRMLSFHFIRQPKQLMICEDKSNIIYLKMIAKNIANMKLKDESDLAFAQQ